jgi:hypothetical protein
MTDVTCEADPPMHEGGAAHWREGEAGVGQRVLCGNVKSIDQLGEDAVNILEHDTQQDCPPSLLE